MGLDAVVDVHVGGEVGPVAEGGGHVLEALLEVPADEVGGGRPEVVLDPVVGAGEGPRHLDLDHVVGAELGLDGVGVLLEHEEGGDGYVLSRAVVGHDGLGRLADVLPVGRDAVGVAAQAGVVGDDDAGGAGPLGVADRLHEGAVAAVDHEDVRAGPGLHLAVLVLGPDGIALPRVDGRVAEVGIGVVHVLRDRPAVRGDAEQGLAVVVAVGLEQRLRDVNLQPARDVVRRGRRRRRSRSGGGNDHGSTRCAD